MNNESRNLRSGQSTIVSGIARAFGDDQPSSPAIVIQTIDDPLGETYPTVAKSVFAVVQQSIEADETAGQPVTLTPTGGAFYAANVGLAVPPVNQGGLIAILIENLYVFSYNG